MLNTTKKLRPALIAFLCAGLVLSPIPRASATAVADYGPLLVLIVILISAPVQQVDLPQGSKIVTNQLETAVQAARAASLVGNSTAEFSRLSKAIGAAQALMGMTSACSDCGEVRDILQQIIGQASVLKTRIAGASGSCNPNGIIQPNEQCDPLAIPSGCPVNATAATYCS